MEADLKQPERLFCQDLRVAHIKGGEHKFVVRLRSYVGTFFHIPSNHREAHGPIFVASVQTVFCVNSCKQLNFNPENPSWISSRRFQSVSLPWKILNFLLIKCDVDNMLLPTLHCEFSFSLLCTKDRLDSTPQDRASFFSFLHLHNWFRLGEQHKTKSPCQKWHNRPLPKVCTKILAPGACARKYTKGSLLGSLVRFAQHKPEQAPLQIPPKRQVPEAVACEDSPCPVSSRVP